MEAFYDAADQKLKNTQAFMFLNSSELMRYDRAYRSVYGSVNYNKEFGKSKLDGCNNCTLIGLDNIPVGFKIITPGSNMLIGLATEGTNCNSIGVSSYDNTLLYIIWQISKKNHAQSQQTSTRIS